MSHQFHTDRHALHGITVVLDTTQGETYLGRFDSQDERGVHLLDVSRRDPDDGGTREEYIRKNARFGIRVERKHVLVPTASVSRVTPLGEIPLE